MNRALMQAVFDKIEQYRRIVIFRHRRIDGDCVGASKGFQAIIRDTWPEKEVYVIDNEHSDFLSFLGPADAPIPDECYQDALGIVVDTASTDRISNPKFSLCKELIKIDHHIELDRYGDIQWVEDWRSSLCEMIVAFYDAFQDRLILSQEAAACLYTGMVTDSGRFRYEGVSGDTLRLAALLLDRGVDTETLFAHLYLHDVSELRLRAYIYENLSVTENGVAYIRITQEIQKRFGLTLESASASISNLENIRGCLCWIAFIDNGDAEGSIRVRLRSRFLAINSVAEHFRGGGHASASGATVYNDSEIQALLKEADYLVGEYKKTHEGWL